jgi:cysteinyl-tRNA synthetase
MSKSLHNFVTIREFLEKHSAETFRFIAASTHYRNEIEYSEELITESMNRLNNIYATLSLLNHCKETDTMTPKAEIFMKHFEEFEKSFEDFMDNDFETQSALNGLVVITNELRSFIESEKCIQKRLKDYIFSSVQKLAGVIGILESKHYMDPLPAAAEKLISEREAFRKSGNFKESDVLRERIRSEFGIVVEDSKENSTWYWLAPKS